MSVCVAVVIWAKLQCISNQSPLIGTEAIGLSMRGQVSPPKSWSNPEQAAKNGDCIGGTQRRTCQHNGICNCAAISGISIREEVAICHERHR